MPSANVGIYELALVESFFVCVFVAVFLVIRFRFRIREERYGRHS